jgi:hypothetical protein
MDIESENIKFVEMLQLRKKITKTFNKIADKIDILKKIYKDMMSENEENISDGGGELETTYLHSMFGIDTFLFQHKLIEIEYANVLAIFKMIDNRIYYEYYKLYTMVQEYIKKEFSKKSSAAVGNDITQIMQKKFQPYKHLDSSKEYDISNTAEMQSIITETLKHMCVFLEKRENVLKENRKQIKKGINIDTLIHTQNYHNAMIRSNITMFTQYLNTFNSHHTSYLGSLLHRSTVIMRDINKNIKLNGTPETSPKSLSDESANVSDSNDESANVSDSNDDSSKTINSK